MNCGRHLIQTAVHFFVIIIVGIIVEASNSHPACACAMGACVFLMHAVSQCFRGCLQGYFEYVSF